MKEILYPVIAMTGDSLHYKIVVVEVSMCCDTTLASMSVARLWTLNYSAHS